MNENRRHGKVSILTSLGEALGISSRRGEERTRRMTRASSRKHLRSDSPRGIYAVELYPQHRSNRGSRRQRLVSSTCPSDVDVRDAISSDESSDPSSSSSDSDSEDFDIKRKSCINGVHSDNTPRQKVPSSMSSTLISKSSHSGGYRLTSSDISQSTFSIHDDEHFSSRRKHKHNPLPREEFQKAVAEFKKDYNRKLENSKTTKSKTKTSDHGSTGARKPLSTSYNAGNQKAHDCVSDDETVIDDNDSLTPEQTPEGRSRASLMLDGHFCMGCGIRRAPKHQIERAQKSDDAPWKNLCKPCLKKYCDGSKYAMDEFGHLCWGCGFARSAHFHSQHPVGHDEEPVPNICSFCRLHKNKNAGGVTEKVSATSSTTTSVTPDSTSERPDARQPLTLTKTDRSSSQQIHRPSHRRGNRSVRRQDPAYETSPSTPSSVYRQPTVESDSDTSDQACNKSTAMPNTQLGSDSDVVSDKKENGMPSGQAHVDAPPGHAKGPRHGSPLIGRQNQEERQPSVNFHTPAPDYVGAFHESERIRRQMYEEGPAGPVGGCRKTSSRQQQRSNRAKKVDEEPSDPFLEPQGRGRAPTTGHAGFSGPSQSSYQPQHHSNASFLPSEAFTSGLGNTYQEKQRIARERAHYFANMGQQRPTSQRPRSSAAPRESVRPQHQEPRPSTSGCDGQNRPQGPREPYGEPISLHSFPSRREPVLPETGFVEELSSDDESVSPGSTRANVGQTLSTVDGRLVHRC